MITTRTRMRLAGNFSLFTSPLGSAQRRLCIIRRDRSRVRPTGERHNLARSRDNHSEFIARNPINPLPALQRGALENELLVESEELLFLLLQTFDLVSQSNPAVLLPPIK